MLRFPIIFTERIFYDWSESYLIMRSMFILIYVLNSPINQLIDHTQWRVDWARKTFLGWIRVNDLCTKQCIYAHLKVDSSFILFIYTHSHFPLLRFSFFIANIVYEMYFLECNECSNQKWKESQMLNVFSWEFCIYPI